LDNEIGTEVAKNGIQTLIHVAKASYGIKEIQLYGGVFSLLKALTRKSLGLKRVTVECLVECSFEPKYRNHISNAKLVKTLLSLFRLRDLKIANDVARVLGNISDISSVKETLQLEGGIKTILLLLNQQDLDLSLILMKMMMNLLSNKEIALNACNIGFVQKIDTFLRSESNELRKYACKNLFAISGFNEVSKEMILSSVHLNSLLQNLDYQENIETARSSYGVLGNLLSSISQAPKVIEKGLIILPNIAKILESLLPINQLSESMRLLPSLVRLRKNRRMVFSLRIDMMIGRLLKRILELTESESDQILIFTLQFLGILVEEEYQNLETSNDHDLDTKEKVLQNCIQHEDLFDTLLKILQKYSTKEKFNLEVLKQVLYVIETISYEESYNQELVQKGLIRQVVTLLQLNQENKKSSLTSSVISMLAFYSDKEKEWLNMCKTSLAHGIFSLLNSNNTYLRERAKTCLYDLSFCTLFPQVVNELLIEESIKPLLEAYQKEDPGIKEVLTNLAQDQTFKVKLKSFLAHRFPVMAKGQDLEGLNYLKEMMGSKKFKIQKQVFYSVKDLMNQGYNYRKNITSSILQKDLLENNLKMQKDQWNGQEAVDDVEDEQILNPVKYYEPPVKPIEDQQPNEPEEEEYDEGLGEEMPDQVDDGNVQDIDEDDDEQDAEVIGKRDEIIDAQREFLQRNGQGDWLSDLKGRVQGQGYDLGSQDEHDAAGNPWDRMIKNEVNRLNEGIEGEDDGDEGEDDEEFDDQGQGQNQGGYPDDGQYGDEGEEEYDDGEEGEYDDYHQDHPGGMMQNHAYQGPQGQVQGQQQGQYQDQYNNQDDDQYDNPDEDSEYDDPQNEQDQYQNQPQNQAQYQGQGQGQNQNQNLYQSQGQNQNQAQYQNQPQNQNQGQYQNQNSYQGQSQGQGTNQNQY